MLSYSRTFFVRSPESPEVASTVHLWRCPHDVWEVWGRDEAGATRPLPRLWTEAIASIDAASRKGPGMWMLPSTAAAITLLQQVGIERWLGVQDHPELFVFTVGVWSGAHFEGLGEARYGSYSFHNPQHDQHYSFQMERWMGPDDAEAVCVVECAWTGRDRPPPPPGRWHLRAGLEAGWRAVSELEGEGWHRVEHLKR